MCGSMGEAHHLSTEERIQILVAAREALDGAGFTSVPIIAGTGAGSTRETIKLSKDAAQAGADYAIVIPSGYFAGALANDRLAIKTFFKEVAEGSPLPVMVYNCTWIYGYAMSLRRLTKPNRSWSGWWHRHGFRLD